MECPACKEVCGRKLWADQQWTAKDPLANDWLWTCKACVLTKPCHYHFAVYHLKRFVRYLSAAYSLGIYAKMQAYSMVHKNVNHDSKHRSGGLNCGHAVGALFANAVLGPEVASQLFQTYYGGGRFHESFLGFMLGNVSFQTAQDCCIEVAPLLTCGVQKAILEKMAQLMSIAKMAALRLEYDDTTEGDDNAQPSPHDAPPHRSKTLKEKLEDWGRPRMGYLIDRLEETIFILRDGMSEETNNFLSSDSDVKLLTTEALVVLEDFFYLVRGVMMDPGPRSPEVRMKRNWCDNVDGTPDKRQKIWKV
eukprot:s106_g26.t1